METKQYHITKSTGDVEIEFVRSDVLERYDALAREALDECRKSITMAMRYLSSPVWYMPFERKPMVRGLATSGRKLYYDPENVVDRYWDDGDELIRDCLHLVLHCVFHHTFDKRHDEFDTWSLACDIAVEACALDLCGKRFPSAQDEARREVIDRLSGIARNLTADALYQVLRHGRGGETLYRAHGLKFEDLERFRKLFKRDGHEPWAGYPREDQGGSGEESGYAEVPDLLSDEGESQPVVSMGADGDDSQDSGSDASDGAAGQGSQGDAEGEHDGEDENADADAEDGDAAADAEDDDDESDQQPAAEPEPEPEFDPADEEALKDWERMSKQVETELRSQMRQGTGSGNLLQNLSIANRKPANYNDFLKKFATVAEDLCVNDDEFDYIFYTYGMQRYGNIPLVEPLEYKESERVREFVIAIDTSGSCSGALVRTFVERTYSVLRNQTAFGDEINIHLIQCDNAIRSATKVTSIKQLEKYEESFWVSGGGGTDFRPVFEYVETLLEDGEFEDLRGLIYFTDGYGIFPSHAPDYDVAFVFVDSERSNVRVPAWAMKVLMTSEEVMER